MLAGLALMAGGTAVTIRGQKKAEEAAVNVRRAEDSRQKRFKDEAEAAFGRNEAALDSDNIKGNMKATAATREAAYAAANANAPRSIQQASSNTLGGNKVVDANLGSALQAAGGRVQQQGAARADLGSFGQTMFDANILTGRGRSEIAQQGDFSRGSMNAIGAELESAKNRGKNMRMLGSVLTAVGGAMMGGAGAAAGAGGVGAGAGAATGAASGGAAAAGGAATAGAFGNMAWMPALTGALGAGTSSYAAGGN
jgi:hypothetical protein